jgi:hypothetical protein
MMGSIDAYSYEPSDGLIENLTDEEKQNYSHTLKQNDRWKSEVACIPLSLPPVGLKRLPTRSSAGDFEPSEAWAADTWAAIEALTKAMRKAGYPKPRKAPQKAADAPMPGQAGLPLGDAPETPGNAS